MRKIYLYWIGVFCCCLSAFAGAEPTASNIIVSLAHSPSAAKLAQFKKICSRTEQVDFDGSSRAAKAMALIVKSGNRFGVRALVYALMNCSDGASAEGLEETLGDALLLKHPQAFLEALGEESFSGDTGALVRQVQDEKLRDCDQGACKKALARHFLQKREAISHAAVSAKFESIRKAVLAAIPNQ